MRIEFYPTAESEQKIKALSEKYPSLSDSAIVNELLSFINVRDILDGSSPEKRLSFAEAYEKFIRELIDYLCESGAESFTMRDFTDRVPAEYKLRIGKTLNRRIAGGNIKFLVRAVNDDGTLIFYKGSAVYKVDREELKEAEYENDRGKTLP